MPPIPIEVDEKIFATHFPKKDGVSHQDVRITDVGVYSMTKPRTADRISAVIASELGTKDAVITDAFANVGGACFSLARTFTKVNAIEKEPLHVIYLRHNLKVFNLLSKVTILLGDSLSVIPKLRQDVIFIDPPWGGPSYKSEERLRFPLINGKHHIASVIRDLLKTPGLRLIAMLYPHNFDTEDFKDKLKHPFRTQLVDHRKLLRVMIIKKP